MRTHGALRGPARPLLLAPILFGVACQPASRDLGELIVVDSLYLESSSGVPYTGPVERRFAADPDRVEIEGTLREGVWHGDFRVYHPNGRTRYWGSFVEGERCGPWIENADSAESLSAYEDLVREVESMGLYPPCSDERDRGAPMGVPEIVMLAAITIGFFWLIMYAAFHARSKDEDQR